MREIEDGAFPFVVSVIPPHPDEAFFHRYFDTHAELLARREPWVHLCDLRMVAKLPDARVRNLLAERSRALDPFSARYTKGAAMVVENSVVRGILRAIYWVSPPPCPYEVVATPREGVAFLRDCLARANLPPCPRMTPDLVELVRGRLSSQPTARRSLRP